MRTEVEVVSPEEYEEFVKQQKADIDSRPGTRRRPDRKRRSAMSAQPAPRARRRRLPRQAPPALGRAGDQRRPQGRRPDPHLRRPRLPLHRPGRAAADAAAAADPGEHLPLPRRLQPDALALRRDRDLPLRAPAGARPLLLRGAAADRRPRHRAAAPRADRRRALGRRRDRPLRRPSSSPPRRPASTRWRRSPSSPSSPTTASTPGPPRPASRPSASSSSRSTC